MLYPRESETREVKDLSGIWEFKVDRTDEGRKAGWGAQPLTGTMPMPVPASYNDITQDPTIRDHIGDAWYEREFFVPASWQGKRVELRVGAASYAAVLFVNGKEVAQHKGGFLPFVADVSEIVRYGQPNRVTICVNNVLDYQTLPPGKTIVFNDETHPPGLKVQSYQQDFFNFAGIHRPVRLICTPKVRISDVTVVTDVQGSTGIVNYTVAVEGGNRQVRVSLRDVAGKEVAAGDGLTGTLNVPNAQLWQPDNAYLYTLRIETAEDVYPLPVGIRTVAVKDGKFLINGQPFYFTGFGKHEDMDVKGKGLDEAMNVKDFNLLKWVGANSFRTSHYPYSEEIMNLADREGLVVIDECSAVGMNFRVQNKTFGPDLLNDATLTHHLDIMREMIARDKNHPCVVMWSISNEPNTGDPGSGPYFKAVAEETRRLDPTRPITLVECLWPHQSHASEHVDVICHNSYAGWYGDCGHPEVATPQLRHMLGGFHKRFNKPILVAEFGADTIAGFHSDPPVMWSEEYQVQMISEYAKAMDALPFIIGEHVWNFADFATAQGTGRAIGNKKGVFTRQRQPKMAAHWLRQRWTTLQKY